MSRRGRIILGIGAAVLLVAGAATYLLWPEPGLYRRSYDATRLGMSVEEVERLVPGGQPDAVDLSRFARSVSGCDWEGVVGGEVRSVHLAGEPLLKGNPAFDGSLFFSNHGTDLQGDPGTTQPLVFGIWQDGRRVATGRGWDGPTESFVVLFDPDGRLIERAYIAVRLERHWVRDLRIALGRLSPF